MSLFARRSDLLNATSLPSDGLSSSTLRARLSSQGPSTVLQSTSSPSPDCQLQLHELNQHFRACFTAADSISVIPQAGGKNGAGDGDALAQLGDSFAQAGLKLHTSVVEQLSQAQDNILSKISEFSQFSSSIISDLDDLYSNLSYPLSATICHSANFPRATIATHLSNVQGQLKLVEEELRGLHDEWEANVRLEKEYRQELVGMSKEAAQRKNRLSQTPECPEMESFKDEVERIVEGKIQALEDIEMQYKEWLQAETMEMMQFILAD